MQIVFNSAQKPKDYQIGGTGIGEYPDAPQKCPFKECGVQIMLKKHGFYTRGLILYDFCGEIKIRRYICCVCKHTVSMLPSFCLAYYTHGVEFVVGLMKAAVETGSKRKAVKAYSNVTEYISRRHIMKYLARLLQNRRLIQYGFNQISPGSAVTSGSPGDNEWTRIILLGTRPTLSPESNTEFHKAIGKSFMSTHNKIA